MGRSVIEQMQARATSDGAGVKLLRVFGGTQPERFDPFLMMDEFGSDQASDYIEGFPSHPHRGFQTITYMLKGKMEHRDHLNNVGLINDGDVQWMTAGKGVIHSEMPKQTEGLMQGFQIWLNLPKKSKLVPASYQDVSTESIPVFQRETYSLKAIAGNFSVNGEDLQGYFHIEDTEAIIMDISIQAGAEASLGIDDRQNVQIYSYEGEMLVGDKLTKTPPKMLSRLSGEGDITIKNTTNQVVKAIVLAGLPIKEPIVQYGPFVMNSMDEIQQAIEDYQTGNLIK